MSEKFNKIVLVDPTGLKDWAIAELQKFSVKELDNYTDYPETESELVRRIGDAECVFVSWNTQITEEVMKRCPGIKYIGMCCSLYDELSANVDISYARKNGITVTGIRDYGDEGLTEFILSELIRLVKGLGTHQWKGGPVELTNRKLGIIGMGTTGKMLAKTALAFQMEVYFYDRSRKTDFEENGIKYVPLKQLLSTCEIISTHLPKNTEILDSAHFSVLGNGKILVNTSLGLTFEKTSFLKWVKCEGNYAIFDNCGVAGNHEEFSKYSHIITTEKVAGWTAEAIERLSQKVVQQLNSYVAKKDAVQ
jgi:lactate dehydrogenase-like 2-hydroxyacid dehydrogenase